MINNPLKFKINKKDILSWSPAEDTDANVDFVVNKDFLWDLNRGIQL